MLIPVLLGTVCGVAAAAQRTESGIMIRVTQAGAEAAQPGFGAGEFLNGYRATVSGYAMKYHSAHPDAEMALIVRARRDQHSISWETDPLPEADTGEYYRFVWLAGIEQQGWGEGKQSHTFEFFINGERWFTFRNFRDATAKKWKLTGRDGAELSFEGATADKFGDLFGYMFLKVPKKAFRPGAPLVLQVVGEDAESPDWYMTFQHRFHFTPRVRVEPAVLRDGDSGSQMLRLSLDNLTAGRTVEISTPNREPIKAALSVGANIFLLPIPAVSSERVMPVVFQVNDTVVDRFDVKLKPVTQRTLYLLPYSHNDIGYTDLQPNIERKQWRNLEQALALIQATRNYPPDARFKWNLETLWALDTWLRQAPEQKRREVLDAVRNGDIGVTALYANLLTGLANAVEMSHFTEFARRLRTEYSIPVTTAVTSDIPGFTWGIVTALAQSGVKYFAIAPNMSDRIGYTLEMWGDKPFYWTSQSGEERVLAWVAGASYASFHEGELSKLGDEKILKLVRQLDASGYPYEMVHLPYTVGGDNGPPDPDLPDFVKRWNERYVTPRLAIATHEQMFREFEARYGATLPSFRGDFTPYWEDGAASTAFETALTRRAVDRLVQGEALWSLLAPKAYPETDYAAAWRGVVLWDEHTWGAHNSVSEPDLPFVKGQWEFKQRFALEAEHLSRELLAKALGGPARVGRGKVAFDVYNTNSWPRTDLVLLAREQSLVGDAVVDERSQPVPSQRLSTGELAVLAENVPPLAAKRFFVRRGRAQSGGSAKASGNVVENSLIAVTVNERTGAIESLRWKATGNEFVDTSKGLGLNEYLYVAGRDPANAQPLGNIRVKVKEQGGVVASLGVQADAPGSKHYSSEIRVVHSIGRVDIINDIDKKAVREKEGVHIGFAFRVPGGQLRYDVANGIVRPEADQLPGACKNFFSVQSWVDVSNRASGITWATVDAPLIEIGAITAEQGWMKSVAASQTIYSYVMNNYWHTNYKAEQEGPVRFVYSLLPHGEFRPEEAARFGRERREPLVVAAADASVKPAASLVRLAPPEVLVHSVRPIDGGRAWLVYLYNPTGSIQNARLEWDKAIPVVLRRSDAFGTAGEELSGGLKIAAYGSVYLRADRTSRVPGKVM
jgi:hypothetical protein